MLLSFRAKREILLKLETIARLELNHYLESGSLKFENFGKGQNHDRQTFLLR